VFVHQDGVLLCTTLRALAELGILGPSLEDERPLSELCPGLEPAGFGSLRVGLRCLASQGWLEHGPPLEPAAAVLSWTETGRAVSRYWDRYVAAGRLLSRFAGSDPGAWSRQWDAERTEAFLDLLPLACERWRLDPDLPAPRAALVTTHLDAALVVPAMLWLRGRGLLGGDGPALPDGDSGAGVGRLLAALGWTGDDGRWTAAGREAAGLSVHFGMAASYLPLLARLPELYRGSLVVAPPAGGAEWHVNRSLNVSASAAAHVRYFADADEVFVELFNRRPVEAQPRFVADMGCGDGSWLVRLHRLIAERTLRGAGGRGEMPLMVGVDYNAAALEQARSLLDDAGVPALLVQGDVSDPDALAASLSDHGLAMEDGLHIRAFLDHDRRYRGAGPGVDVRGRSSGAYLDQSGGPLGAAAVEGDLVAHLRRWSPHVRRHGMLVLEAHCVAPEVARRHLGATHAVAFDAYHGYSHQYPVEHSAFLHCLREAGLRRESHCERRYPASRPFTAVSLNRLLVTDGPAMLPGPDRGAPRGDSWRPEPGGDLGDGRALHELLYSAGDLRHPRSWCSAATGFVVARALEVVEAQLEGACEGDAIRVLDYGAGTGLAAIELLKACRERGVEQRLEAAGATLELHLVDLPSSWFAQGFELLRGCSWTRFHSLRAAGGGFRPLAELTGGEPFDAVMANMVFHLIPGSAVGRVAADLAGVVRPGGRLSWNSPDLGPAGPYAVLFHDANRALRARWLELLDAPDRNGQGSEALPAGLHEALRAARGLGAVARREAQGRADRRVLPRANSADDVAAALAAHFTGAAELRLPTYELLEEDVLDTLLVPSNQEEYLAEIEDPGLRAQVVRELMLGEVLPAMRQRPAGTSEGLNVQWTLGALSRS
jgi:SAM-dependent methyltransferase